MSCSAHSMVPVRLEVAGAIATIVLARPPVNALDVPMLQALIAALQQVDESPDIRAAILTGEGRCFSAGVDLKAQLAALEAGEAGPMDLGVALYDALLHGRKPLIAAINGHALGAGLGMAASCNILVAAEGVQFGLPEIDVGALGGARHAMRLLGHSTVNRMLLTGHRLTAEELAHRGAIEACLPADQLMAYAHGIARQIASKDPTAISLARQCLAAVEVMPVLDGYAHESRLGRQLGETAEARALMRRFLARGAG
jgi:enoyl-CoA hydratase